MAKAEDDKRAEATNNARARARARAKTRVVARTKASGAMAESNEGEVAEAPKYDSAEVRDETLPKNNVVEAAEATEDAGTESKEDDVTVNIYDFQKLGTEQLASNTTAASSFLDRVQAIVAEATEYSKKSIDDRLTFVEKLLGAKSLETVIRIQSDYAKTSYEDFVAQTKKMGELYSDLTKAAFKPFEVANVQGTKQ